MGNVPFFREIVKLDINIRDDEAEKTFLFRSYYGGNHASEVNYRYLVSRRLSAIKMTAFQNQHKIDRDGVIAYYECG